MEPMTLFLVLVIILGSVISIIKDEDPNEMHFSFEPQSEVECSNVIVAQSEFGLGCFAKRDFKEGEIIERGVMMPLPGVDGNEYDISSPGQMIRNYSHLVLVVFHFTITAMIPTSQKSVTYNRTV